MNMYLSKISSICRVLENLHTDSWYLGFCFKAIFKMMRTMLVEFLENNKESPKLVESINVFMKEEAFEVMDDMWANRNKTKLDTLVHGDCWAANILFGREAGHGTQAYLLDFQQVGVGNPLRDILSLLYSSTTMAFRSKFQDSLLKTYYSILKKYFHGYFFMSSCSYEMFYQLYLVNRKFGFVWGLYIVSVGEKIKDKDISKKMIFVPQFCTQTSEAELCGRTRSKVSRRCSRGGSQLSPATIPTSRATTSTSVTDSWI